MVDDDAMEQVWENGQIVTHGRSKISTPPCISDSFHSAKAQIKNDTYLSDTKGARLGTPDAISGDCPSLRLSDDGKLSKLYIDLQDEHRAGFLPGLYGSDLDMVWENIKNNQYDKHITESHVVPEYKESNWPLMNPSEFVPDITQRKKAKNNQLHQSSLEQRQGSVPFNRSFSNAIQTHVSVDGVPNSKLQQMDSGPEKHSWLQNFSLFRPRELLKGNDQANGATRPATNPSSPILEQLHSNEMKRTVSGRNLYELPMFEQACGSKSVKCLQNCGGPIVTMMEPIRPVPKPQENPPPDEQSEAVVPKDTFTSKRYPDQELGTSSNSATKIIEGFGKSIDQMAATTSLCSRGASNDPSSLKIRYEDTKGMANPRGNDKEEHVGATKQSPSWRSAGTKRRRTSKVHNLSERRRRNKINKKMRALQGLIPYSNKEDKATMLDEAINYMKALQLQVQIMSMGTGIFMPPWMLHTGMPHTLHAPHFAPISPMGFGMGMGMHMGVGCSSLPVSSSGMLGFPGQVLPMPFFPFNVGRPTPIPGVASPLDLLGSASLFSSRDVIRNINSEMSNNGNVLGSIFQASSSQVVKGSPHQLNSGAIQSE